MTVPAEGQAAITFQSDLKNVTPDGDLEAGTSYDIYRGTSEETISYATTRTYNDGTWSNAPEIYWKDGSTSYYFRGLATLDADNKVNSVNKSTEAAQGTDLLWATTPEHTGTSTSLLGEKKETVKEGEAIEPRTSHVPMSFRHAMSKVTFKLETSNVEASKVDLTDAKITIPGLYKSGTINVASGEITGTGETSSLETKSEESTIVIPQDVKGKKITITLKDGTTYTYTLADDAVWERGNDYTYTVTLKKESIVLRALIKEWNVKTGGGSATLDWD